MDNRLHRTHPHRPPDWRFRRVLSCFQHRRRLARSDDQGTLRLFHFLRRLCVRQDEATEMQLARGEPDQWLAHQLHQDIESDLRWVVEARLLSGEPRKDIAAKTGVRAKAISIYESSYFDVQSRLHCSDFICRDVINSGYTGGSAQSKEIRMLKFVGYACGSQTLDTILWGGNPAHCSSGNADPGTQLADHASISIREKLLAAVRSLDPGHEKGVREILRVYTEMEKLRQNSGYGMPGSTDYEKHVASLLEQIPWSVGTKAASPELEEFRTTAVELRADEQLQVCAGKRLRNAKELKELRFPATREE